MIYEESLSLSEPSRGGHAEEHEILLSFGHSLVVYENLALVSARATYNLGAPEAAAKAVA